MPINSSDIDKAMVSALLSGAWTRKPKGSNKTPKKKKRKKRTKNR